MRGYWDEPELTARTIDPAGWMHSGDLATIDEEGYCNIVGRVKDMLIRGGENIYPREIEDFLLTHPDIQDAQVFGIPHARYGEEVCAWVIPSRRESVSEASVLEFCAGKIAHFKVPGKVRVVDQFPMTVTGKPQKFEMRKQMMLELGLSDVASA
jgi:fatty-acyl-CoA synthase